MLFCLERFSESMDTANEAVRVAAGRPCYRALYVRAVLFAREGKDQRAQADLELFLSRTQEFSKAKKELFPWATELLENLKKRRMDIM